MKKHLEHLRAVPMFQTCSDKELGQISKLAEELSFDAGEVVMKEGAIGHEFYVIASGTAVVSRDGVAMATLGPGDFFGELALLDPGPRNATVTMQSGGTVLEITQRPFWQLLEDVPAIARKLLQGMARRTHAEASASV